MVEFEWVTTKEVEQEKIEKELQAEIEKEQQKQVETINEFVIEQVTKMIEADELREDEKRRFLNVFPPFTPRTDYEVGEKVRYQGEVYEVIQAHTSQADWTPEHLPALFKVFLQPETDDGTDVIHEWKQPLGGHDAYNTGDLVSYNESIWESDVDGNVWAPGVYGWTEIEQA